MKEKAFNANITVWITQYEGEEELTIDDICRPLEEEGYMIHSAILKEGHQ